MHLSERDTGILSQKYHVNLFFFMLKRNKQLETSQSQGLSAAISVRSLAVRWRSWHQASIGKDGCLAAQSGFWEILLGFFASQELLTISA